MVRYHFGSYLPRMDHLYHRVCFVSVFNSVHDCLEHPYHAEVSLVLQMFDTHQLIRTKGSSPGTF